MLLTTVASTLPSFIQHSVLNRAHSRCCLAAVVTEHHSCICCRTVDESSLTKVCCKREP